LLGTPVNAGPERVAGALRHRGVARDDADAVRGWLSALVRRRYGPGAAPAAPSAPGTIGKVLARLRRGFTVAVICCVPGGLAAQGDAAERYDAGDYAGAARGFAGEAVRHPHDPAAWTNLAAARSMAGDDVGAAAALLRGIALTPRDRVLRHAWQQAATIPADVRALAPTVPVSRDEMLIAAAVLWIITLAAVLARRRQVARFAALATLVVAIGVGVRWYESVRARALVRPTGRLLVSPHPTAPPLGDVAAWSLVRLERFERGWWLVRTTDDRRGWIAEPKLAPLASSDR
jgi:hypothetical protein